MTRTILDLVKERVVLLDGGMGTELIRHGFPQGECPESCNE
jgi:5-methyltetrahydrofolate--homocysteine methyltransferase